MRQATRSRVDAWYAVRLDVDPARLWRAVSPAEWTEAGVDDDAPVRLGRWADGEPVAAAALRPWDGDPCDVGVVVAPAHRGRGHGTCVGRSAASWAVTHHGLAVWRAHERNTASLAAASRLGFEPVCGQLALRPGA